MVTNILLGILIAIFVYIAIINTVAYLNTRKELNHLSASISIAGSDINQVKHIIADEFVCRKDCEDGKRTAPVVQSNTQDVPEEKEMNFDYQTPFTFVSDVLSGKRDLDEH